jgi:hypothetical protein
VTNFGNHRARDSRETRRPSIEEQQTLRVEVGPVISILVSRDCEVELKFKSIAEASATRIRGKSLVVLQVNCRRV